jgi:MSHA biogenesis protein MshP
MLKTSKKGFALPSAIFLLVILSLMAVGVFAINGYSQKSVVFDISDTKAYFAAKTGLEYGSYMASKMNSCSSTPQTVSLSGSYFVGFKTTYSCVQTTSDEAGVSQTYYTITSYGCNTTGTNCPEAVGRPSNEDYVEKSMVSVIAKY